MPAKLRISAERRAHKMVEAKTRKVSLWRRNEAMAERAKTKTSGKSIKTPSDLTIGESVVITTR